MQLSSARRSRRLRAARRLIVNALAVPLVVATMSVSSVANSAASADEKQGSITLLGPDLKSEIMP